jgi:hypothetical protein
MTKANLAVVARSAAVSESPEVAHAGRPRVAGKFFFHNGEKVFVRGVTYGPFASGSHGAPFPECEQVERDFAEMRELGANCVRTFTTPPRWLLDQAERAGLWVLVGLAWTQHACFPDSPETMESNRQLLRDGVYNVAGHRAILAYLIGTARAHGVRRRFGPRSSPGRSAPRSRAGRVSHHRRSRGGARGGRRRLFSPLRGRRALAGRFFRAETVLEKLLHDAGL